MSYCQNCAAVLSPGLMMCPRCGLAVTPAPPLVQAHQPAVVRNALILLLIAWAIPLLMIARVLILVGTNIGVMAQSLAGAALWLLLIALLWKRQGWARFGVLLLLLYGLSGLAFSMLRFSGAIGRAWIPALATDILRICAAFLLFRPESNAWYSRR